jgi:hypothetical protein
MEESGYGERKARELMAEQAYWRDLQENNPAEFAFQEAMLWWKANLRKLLKAGEISYDVIIASSTPMHTEDISPVDWPRIQAWVRANVPWKTEGQRLAYERGYHERQRAHALRLFNIFTPKRRTEEWRGHWHKEKPPGWWQSGDTKAWGIWRAELARLIADDNRRAF